MEAPSSQKQDIITRLCSSGEGLAVLFETVATVYQSDSSTSTDETDGEAPTDNWTVVGYGIPSVIATQTEVTISIADFDEDLPGHEITITSSTQFMLLSDNFSVIGEHNNTYYGICFADVAVARKIASLIVHVLPVYQHEGDGNAAKRLKLSSSSMEGESDPRADNEWVIVEQEDVPDTVEESGESDGEEEGEEDVDAPRLFSRKSQKRRSRSNSPRPPISDPSQFRHVSHVGQDTPVGELTKSMQAPIGDYKSTMQSHRESGTTISSFTEVFASGPGGGAAPPPPPPPTAPPPPPPPAPGTMKIAGAKPLPGMSLQAELLKGVTLKATHASDPGSNVAGSIAEELKRGITLRPVGTLGKQPPKPPPRVNQGQLLFEIHTFKRNTLRHVETKSKNMTDYQNEDPNSLQTLLRSRLEKMREKLSMRNFSRVGSVSGEGEEGGFEDEFDGPLFG